MDGARRFGVWAALATLLLLLAPAALTAGGRGFRSEHYLDDHFNKHGREFGDISRHDYLKMAQQLRDAKPSPEVLESRRADGGFARYDKRRGWFGVYDSDGTIRTFFIPNDGLRYFRRQANSYAGRFR